jgi:hypothetical protein
LGSPDLIVTPAEAGVQVFEKIWIPAFMPQRVFAGMTRLDVIENVSI